MDDANLVRMANQIAEFYTPYSEAEAIEGVATHLKKFWDPRMRNRLITLAQMPDCGLRPITATAVERLITLS
jgi:formate dehydrogenase subunit delta